MISADCITFAMLKSEDSQRLNISDKLGEFKNQYPGDITAFHALNVNVSKRLKIELLILMQKVAQIDFLLKLITNNTK